MNEHHFKCNAGDHEGLCSTTDDEGHTEVYGVTTVEPSYVAIGTAQTWDGRRETAENPYSPEDEIARLQDIRNNG